MDAKPNHEVKIYSDHDYDECNYKVWNPIVPITLRKPSLLNWKKLCEVQHNVSQYNKEVFIQEIHLIEKTLGVRKYNVNVG